MSASNMTGNPEKGTDDGSSPAAKPASPAGYPNLRYGSERGNCSKYKAEYAVQAQKLARLGATDAEIAEFFGVTDRTLRTWKHEHPKFATSLQVGKDEADDRVERALYNRAVGYTHDAVKIMQYEGQVIREDYVNHVPPDVSACMYWLNNRRSKNWRWRVEQTHNIDDNLADALKAARERAASR